MKKMVLLFFGGWLLVLMSVCHKRVAREPLVILKEANELQQIVAQVCQDSLTARINTLEHFGSRYTAEQQAQAAEFIFAVLKRQGLDPQFHDYVYKNKGYRNVEAVIRGRRNPNQYLVIAAHYDAKSDSAETSAPGADDNASGVAALLELARILSQCELANSVRLVFFSNEEQGHQGSRHYVSYLQTLREQYLAAMVVDCIGYRRADSLLTIATLPRYEWLALAAHECMQMALLSYDEVRIDEHCL